MTEAKDSENFQTCQHCLIQIPPEENHFYLGDMHSTNLRDFSKVSSLSTIFNENDIPPAEFHLLMKTRERIKAQSETQQDHFIRSCHHVIHEACLDKKYKIKDHEIFGKNSFPCGQCRSPMNLPIPYFGKDSTTQILPIVTPTTAENQNATSQPLWNFFKKLKLENYEKEKNYSKETLFVLDQANLGVANDSTGMLSEFAFRFMNVAKEH